MEFDELTRRIRDFVRSNFYLPEAAALSDEASLLEDGVIDSTGVLELIAFIESTFGITVEDHEMLPENLGSIKGAAAFVGRKLAHALAEQASA